MDPLFRIVERLPVAAGQSPFHFRGFYYDRLISRIQKAPGGLSALCKELEDDTVREFLKQRFKWNTWYDALPTVPVYAALARIEDTSFEETVLRGARQAARDLVPRMFRSLFSARGRIAARLTGIMLHAVDFGRVRFETVTDGSGAGFVSGIPLIIAPSITNVFVGWIQGMLETAGALEINGRYSEVMIDGNIEGYDTITARLTFKWIDGPK